MIVYSAQMRQKMCDEIQGKTVLSLHWIDSDGGYWVMTFTDHTEISFRFMSELMP